MKILNICMGATFTENYSYQDNLLSEYQQKHGNEVTVITTTRTHNKDGKIVRTHAGEKILENGVKLVRVEPRGKLFQFLGIYPQLGKLIAHEAPDFIFVHGLASFVIAQAVRYKKKHKEIKIVADNHQDGRNTYTKTFPHAICIHFFLLMWKHWIKYIEKVYGTTSWRVTFAHDVYAIPYEKLDILIMGIDTDRLPLERNEIRAKVRSELGIRKESFVFVTGGKLDKQKKTLTVMHAFIKLPAPQATLLIFGPVAEDIKEEFHSLIERDSRIRYIGFVESKEIHQCFYASDFGVFPGGHSVLWEEAIGCKLPCIFKKYGEWDHTDVCGNCVRLEETTENAIYEIMEKALHDKVWYCDIKQKAEQAAEAFSYHTIADKSVECA